MSKGPVPLIEPALFLPLRHLVEVHHIQNIVETGAGPRSSGMHAADIIGLRGYTCDVFAPCVERVREIYPGVVAANLNSEDFFRAVLPQVKGPTFFWLDGHCPTDLACKPGSIFPVYPEITLIKELKAEYERDVIWIDDIAMIDVPDNPHRSSWDVDLAGTRWFGEKSHAWEEYIALLSDTHNHAIIDDEILEFTPK